MTRLALLRRVTAMTLTTLVLALIVLAGGLWVWSGHDGSLAQVVRQLPRVLPVGQDFASRNISGSLRDGGHIEWMRWQQGDLSIEASDVTLGWSLPALLQRTLEVTRLRIGQLRIDDQRTTAAGATIEPPTNLLLPLKLDVQLQVDKLHWQGAGQQSASGVAGHYVFDGTAHRLDKGTVQLAAGSYSISGQLQAAAPMALALHVTGQVQADVPSGRKAINVEADATLNGELAGANAMLALQAMLVTPSSAAGVDGPSANALQATLSAKLAPWQTQPIVDAKAQWQGLNLALLWPQAPHTRLDGDAEVAPADAGWQARVKLRNTQSGPLNLQRLPLQSLNARLTYQDERWALQTLDADAGGGHIAGAGHFSAGLWQGQARVTGVNPAQVDTRWESVPISGKLLARQGARGIDFDVDLRADSENTANTSVARPVDALQALRLQTVVAQGQWATPVLTLNDLRVQARDAQLQGRMVYHSRSQAMQGKLSLDLPGLQAVLEGQLARTDGMGTLSMQLNSATQTARWLAQWPVLASALQGSLPSGSARLSAHWQGGWQDQGNSMRIETTLQSPQFEWAAPGPADAPVLRLSALQAHLSGTPGAFQLDSRGLADTGPRQVNWSLAASAGRGIGGAWHASVEQLKLSLRPGIDKPLWSLQLGAGRPQLNWLSTVQGDTLSISAGQAQLQGPMPGAATVQWQPVRWTRLTGKTAAAAQWESRGRISSLPLSWLDAVSARPMSELGLSSDLLFEGRWDAAQTTGLHLQATLERSSGDLRLKTGDSRQPVLPAELRDAWLQVDLNQRQLAASLRWDSLRAGKALAAFSTEIDPGNWRWPDAAAVGGSIQLQAPPVDAWTALAPPGWRLHGTVDADIALSGTRSVPQWSGHLRARDLAVRSVVDGIDFSQGSLNARLHGQQLDIESATLRGAGDSGGVLTLGGSLLWVTDSSVSNLASHLRMSLTAELKALRLSGRPDRRLSASGKLDAVLRDKHLVLSGALTADHALITLPDTTAPQLGDDVVVRLAGSNAPPPGKSPASLPQVSAVSIEVRVELNPGADFQVRGRGLEARLAGKVTVQGQGFGTPSLNGTLRTANGTYQAYGQRLTIEEGVLRFNGPLDNPALSILAIRPQLTQRVGVQISGTALSPIVRLYADPDLPDAEKLSWLVLGRSAASGGAEAALMQQAAMTLLSGDGKSSSGGLAQAIGLDEVSFQGNGNASDGSASTASVTLGKRLSSDFYVAYEHSLAGTMGVFSIFYDLSKRLTLRAQAGEQSAVDLIFTLRYD